LSAPPRTEKTGAGLTDLLGYRHDGVVQRFARLHGVARERAEALFVETLKWLWLARRAREASPLGLVLSIYPDIRGIDEMWHVFLLFTRDYAALCDAYLGGFVHHQPNPDGPRQAIDEVALAAELRALYSFVYDELGEATLRAWFEERRFASPSGT
jgi:hypothetical protein